MRRIAPLLLGIAHALRGPPLAHRPRLAPRRATALDKIDAAVDNTLNKTRSWGPARQAGVVLATYAAHAGALGRQTDRLAFQASWPIRRRRPRVPRSQAWAVREGALQGVCTNAEQQRREEWHFFI